MGDQHAGYVRGSVVEGQPTWEGGIDGGGAESEGGGGDELTRFKRMEHVVQGEQGLAQGDVGRTNGTPPTHDYVGGGGDMGGKGGGGCESFRGPHRGDPGRTGGVWITSVRLLAGGHER